MSPMSRISAAPVPVLQDASLRFGSRNVLDRITLTLKGGCVNCLLGPSGCGKSTLLRVVAGLLQPDSGQVLVPPTHCATVFQDPRLLPWLSVAENLGLALSGQARPQQAARIRQALAQVQLAGTQDLLPRELSGGMAQRVGIARALLRKPQLLLLDEPFSALDAITRRELQTVLRELMATQQTTCLFVTHDIHEATALGQRLFVMQNGCITQQWDAPWDTPAIRQQIMQALQHAAHHPSAPDTPSGQASAPKATSLFSSFS
ncbi:MAG: ABC transporter ATP-binding protein [Brachymonas sp.]|nr:ABC transporter ATP-binding protein [Brachymonas sp.]